MSPLGGFPIFAIYSNNYFLKTFIFMKLNRISLLIALSVMGLTACKNTIDVLAPYKDVSVVYGLLDQNDKVHYIRISKAFEGPGNAYTMAQQYDSLYYPVNTIKAVLIDSNTTTSRTTSVTLDTTTTIPMPAGTFSYPKQLLYYLNETLNANDYYTLVITNTKTGKTIRGTTGLLSDIAFTEPEYFTNNKNFQISFIPDNPTEIAWTTSYNARIYQLDIRFFYTEIVNNDTANKSLDWIFSPVISPTISGGVSLFYNLTGQGLCTTILNSIPINTYATRYADSLQVIFTTGSDDLNTYVQLSQPPTGINQDVPSFSDVENGVGLFTARHVQTISKSIDTQLLDTLTMETKYLPLNFQQ